MNANAVTLQQNGTALSVPTSETGALLHMIERVARDPSIDLDRLDRLMEMRDRIVKREAQVAFDAAFALMQPELPTIDKKGRIEGTSKKTGENLSQAFGRWEDISPAITPILAKHGFGIRFRQEKVVDPAGAHQTRVTCILSHAQGHREEPYIDLPLDTSGSKNNVQAYGSTISYGKRYAATMALNIVTKDEDDDGKAAGGPECITDEQEQNLNLLMTEVKGNLNKFLEHFKIKKLSELPAAQYDRAIAAIEARRGAKA